MDLTQLRYFLRIADANSMSEAAAAAHVSQPALSRRMRLLEADLGVVLFERGARGVALTDAGRRLRTEATALLREADRVRADIGAIAEVPAGSLTIGAPSSLRPFVMAPAIAAFTQAHPGVAIKLLEGTSRRIRNALAAGEADLALLSTREDLEPFSWERLATEALVLIGPAGSPLQVATPIPFVRLAGLPLILTAHPNSMRTLVEQQARKLNVRIDPRMEVESAPMALDLVEQAGFYTVFPYCAVEAAVTRGRVAAAPIAGLTISWALVASKERQLSTAARVCAAVVKATVSQRISAGLWLTAISNLVEPLSKSRGRPAPRRAGRDRSPTT